MDLDLFDDDRPRRDPRRRYERDDDDRDRRYARDDDDDYRRADDSGRWERPRRADDSGRWERPRRADDSGRWERPRRADDSGRWERSRPRRADDSGHWSAPWAGAFRHAHPHRFAWFFVAGGVIALTLIVLGLLQATGVMPHVANLYFAATTAIMPESWHDEWRSLPDLVHVLIAVFALGAVAGIAGEAFEFFD
ncbi:MAG: hypothetical protein KBG48_24645 [Kofleriaceae bacterium]|jgi:hypothetical protein|nr:hypothetical protein [Kofleriaceae bacterium]MBP9170615.1 hypothetical protein [Kofleriaceae bacterium]MBP9859777.1 hypothetical protein [Kofleriaceae bacterium]